MNNNDTTKIMFLISSLSGGGAERVAANLCNALCNKYQICLVTLFGREEVYSLHDEVQRFRFSDYLDCLPFPAQKLRKLPGHFLRLLWLKKIKQQYDPQITVSMLSLPNLLNVLCGDDLKIVSERADPQKIGGKYYKYARFSLGRADHVVFQSHSVQRMFPEHVIAKSSIILNPVSVKCEAVHAPSKRIVTAGRLTNQKNHRMLIQAFHKFYQRHPEYKMDIFGNGPLRADLEQEIRSSGLEQSVSILDFSTDLHNEIRNAEMFVLSSDYEGLSNALLEAMMMGLPCISTDCAGSDEVIQDGVNGLLTLVGNSDAMAAAMCLFSENAEFRSRIAAAGKASSARFCTSAVTNQWISLIEGMTAIKEHEGRNKS